MAYEFITESSAKPATTKGFIPEKNFLEKYAPSGVKEALQYPAQAATSALSATGGLPGLIAQTGHELVVRPTAHLLGKELPGYEQSEVSKYLPTTQQNIQAFENQFPFLKPSNKSQESIRNAISTATELYLTKGRSALGKSGKVLSEAERGFVSLAQALGSEAAGETVKEATGNKELGNLTKGGVLLLSSLIDKPTVNAQIGQLYQKADAALPARVQTSAQSLTNSMNQIIQSVEKGRPRQALGPGETFVVNQAEKVLNLVQNGQIPVEQAIAQLRTVNQELQKILPETPFSGRGEIKAKTALINGALNQTIREYGHTNPSFYKPFSQGQEATATLHKSNYISNWIQKYIPQDLASKGLSIALTGGAGALLPGAPTKAAALGVYEASKLMHRIIMSPTLRKIYAKIIGEAAKENAPQFGKYVKIMDKELQKEKNQDKYEFID